MYYSYACPYCGRMFYTYNSNKEQAAEALYYGIKKHQHDYGEDEKEHTMDQDPDIETDEIYYDLTESDAPPSGAYELG